MRVLVSSIVVLLCCNGGLLRAQTPDSLIIELRTINKAVAEQSCSPGSGSLISNRAMNIFLSEAAGYYLSATDNLTLYKNSLIADATDGTLAINHNLHQPVGNDGRIGSFLTIGAKADIADAFAARSEGRPYSNRFGFMIKQTWIGKGETRFVPCIAGGASSQKIMMDALRAGILHSLESAILQKVTDFEASLRAWDSSQDVSGQDLAAAKNAARQKFNADLVAEYEWQFAHMQAETLARTFDYKVVSSNWTSISAYLPLVTENTHTAPALSDPLAIRHAYPLHANITHTRFWESSKFGRLFVSLAWDVGLNNSRDAYKLDKEGGDYIGDYKNFVTPTLTFQTIYFPRDSHFGVSFLLEQNFGAYKALNGRIGVPILLVNKKTEPGINFEFQVRFFDLSNQLAPRSGLPGKTSIGLTMGVPLSKIAF